MDASTAGNVLESRSPGGLATDDEGVSRSEMTREYERAVVDQGLDYATLKKMTRTSLEHAFLPGPSLWSDARKFTPVHECANERPTTMPNPTCTNSSTPAKKPANNGASNTASPTSKASSKSARSEPIVDCPSSMSNPQL